MKSIYASFFILLSLSCTRQNPLFIQIKSDDSGIHFANQIAEDEQLNVLNYEYLYNGGGVGIGDFNNDSLPDIYFTGNTTSNKLYINKGNMKFEDVTEAAGVNGNGKWCKGVSVVDINNDGLKDIYVCAAVLSVSNKKKNILYINLGVDKKTGIPHFEDKAAEYGLDDSSNTQMAAFLDYDNDGDLDVYLLENDLDGTYPNEFRPIKKDGSWPNTDRLLRNEYNDTLKHARFTDVSKQAGILIEGHGLGVNITDINNDGWKDVFVSNDYLSNDILYINNHDGTFTDRCAEYFKHTSRNAMGNDIADINNDGLPDMVELDMAPADDYRLKMMYSDIKYATFQNSARYGYMNQYVQNALQLNCGSRINSNDSIGAPVFSEVAYAAGIAHTDWSWAPLLIDVDDDGFRDLLISNGLPKDVTDLDFMSYRQNAVASAPPSEVLAQLPSVKINNYVFRNNGDISFTDKSNEWGWNIPTFSAGMAYADFDRDGDMDVVMNNTNMEATLLENTSEHNDKKNHFLNIKLKGDSSNFDCIGAVIKVYYDSVLQYYDYTPYRGYMSSVENIAHFGLGDIDMIDSVVIIWPGGAKQVQRKINTDQTILISKTQTSDKENYNLQLIAGNNLFSDITAQCGINFYYGEEDFIDFDIQRMLPHKLTQYGPSLASSDINGDGLDDLIVGGGSPKQATLFFQQQNGSFSQKKLYELLDYKYQDDGGMCLFDADADGDMDLYITSGGCENGPGYEAYADNFYVNDGKGNFKKDSAALRPLYIPKSCVKGYDYDNDGDIDLFVGGRSLPGSYPKPVSSFILRNDTKDGKIKFTNVTQELAPALQNIGMVCDAVWSDVDNDGQIDLVIVGEWMAPTILKNTNGKFALVKTNITYEKGWWNSITSADIDNDGDMDYIAGNYGNNGFLQPSVKYPIKAYGKDFDNNGTYDAIFTHYYRTSLTDTTYREFIVSGRDDFIREMSVMKSKFPNYTQYAKAQIKDAFTSDELKDALSLSVTNFTACWIENKGNFQFVVHTLPDKAQYAPVYAVIADDFTGDGNIDIIMTGNEFSMAPQLGRYDALNGLLLQGDGRGNFIPQSILQSGIYIPGNGKTLSALKVQGKPAIAAGQNSGMLKIFSMRKSNDDIINILPGDTYALIHLANGKIRKQEFCYGSSFMSQSAQFISMQPSIKSVEIFNSKNPKRIIVNK